MLDFLFEQSFLKRTVCGIDEVGCGSLAGPVVATAVILPEVLPKILYEQLNDSKLLSARKRESLFSIIHSCSLIGIGHSNVDEIDRLNILQATFLAMQRAFKKLNKIKVIDLALVDGNRDPLLSCQVKCIVNGDRLSLSIAAASIVAKITRDRYMHTIAKIMPGYGWERNVGYGTSEHLKAINRLGVTVYHRHSFAPIAKAISQTIALD
ncbi:MAG: ribonuclease HII [Rhodospirillaceae bacterium]|jgi:ribonuclease HII|nr:ribonuclease HII [Rhodospirillaceae bacterium]